MEKKFVGEINCDGVHYPKSVYRFIEKRIERWLQPKISQLQNAYPKFNVSFERVQYGRSRLILCYVEIRVGSKTWTGTWYGHDLHQTLTRCLEHMMEARTPALWLV